MMSAGPKLGYVFHVQGGFLALKLGDGANTVTNLVSSVALAVDTWIHVAVTVLRESPDYYPQVDFYKDGSYADFKTTYNISGSISNSRPMSMGLDIWSSNPPTNENMILDEVELFSRLLTGDEIAAIHSADTCGKCKPNLICGIKFYDADHDKDKDPLESGLQSWQINIPGQTPQITDQDGNYCFILPSPGTYTVSETPQMYYFQTFPPGAGQHTVNLAPHQSIYNCNFGNYYSKDGNCELKIEADPLFACDPGQVFLISHWLGSKPMPSKCIRWYVSTQDPNGINAPGGTWKAVSATNWGYTITTAAPWISPNCPTEYWYQAVIDNCCFCFPTYSNVEHVRTCQSCFEIIADGLKEICEGDGVTVKLIMPPAIPFITPCNVELWDVSSGTELLVDAGIGKNVFQIPSSYLKVPSCKWKIYKFEIRVCSGVCCKIPYEVKVCKKSKAPRLKADKNPICQFDDTWVYFNPADEYCGDIRWEISQDMGISWSPYPQAGTTTKWNTNKLLVTATFHVCLKNCSCPEVCSDPITIYVLPMVTATLSFDNAECPDVLCPTSTIDNVVFTANYGNVPPPPNLIPPWTWELYSDNGGATGITSQSQFPYTTAVPGTFYIKQDNYPCPFSSNALNVYQFEMKLGGPDCPCFGQSYSGFVVKITHCFYLGDQYDVTLYQVPESAAAFPIFTGTITCTPCLGDGCLDIPGSYTINEKDSFIAYIVTPPWSRCGPGFSTVLYYKPGSGCKCP
jgi:hypothetical protein